MRSKIGGHAVVLGGSMAGLLAARVLADAYEHVTIIERDELPDEPVHRRGVPQSRHADALLPRGCQLIEELFSGLSAELTTAGALAGDMVANVQAAFSGHRLAQTVSGLNVLFLSRRLLESRVRARVGAIDAVTVLDGTDAVDVVSADDGARITGVRVVGKGAGQAEATLAAELVVDATGRGSRTPVWLAQLGLRQPRRESVPVDVRYSTRAFRLRKGALGHNWGILVGATPTSPRAGTLAAIEGGVHLCSVAGFRGDTPPADLPSFLSFTESLPLPDIHDALVDAVPVGEAARLGYPANVRLHYGELRQYPSGLLVIGDALCALNPIYAQGMTVAAMQAAALRRLLATGPINPVDYFHEMGRVIDSPWETATAADLMKNGVTGWRGLRIRLLDRYLSRLQAAAARDPELSLAFGRVIGLIDPPFELLRPRRVARVLRGGTPKREAETSTPEQLAPSSR